MPAWGGGALLLALAGVVGDGRRSALAQGVGTTAGIILELPPTARAAALGGAYAAVVGDEGSVFVNPAGMAPIRRLAIGVSHQRPLPGTSFAAGAAALRVGRFDLGLGLALLDLGSDSVFVPDASGSESGVATGASVSAYEALATLAVAYRRGLLSVGASLKYLTERIETSDAVPYDASGLGVDLGMVAAIFDIAALGVVVQNLGGDLRTSTRTPAPLPRTTRVGFTLNFVDPQGTTRLMATTDWVAPPGGDSYWALGIEGGAVSRGVGVLGRMGLVFGHGESDRESLVYGGGLVLHNLRLDYGYQGYGAIGGATHRFGVRWLQ